MKGSNLYTLLASKRFVDLTHSFGPTTPHWKGFKEETVTTLYTIKKDGFNVQQFTHVGQWGTHIDPPAHFHEGLRTVDQIPPTEMVLPLVVIDVHAKVAKNPDYTLTLDDVQAWEAKHGRIPPHAFVAMRTDWSQRWPDQDAMQNHDAAGVAHPQAAREIAARCELLVEPVERNFCRSDQETEDESRERREQAGPSRPRFNSPGNRSIRTDACKVNNSTTTPSCGRDNSTGYNRRTRIVLSTSAVCWLRQSVYWARI
jgi:kynurenine formamidase